MRAESSSEDITGKEPKAADISSCPDLNILLVNQHLLVKQHTNNVACKKSKPIVSTDKQRNIKVVQTKLVSIFATKFMPDLDAGTLAYYGM